MPDAGVGCVRLEGSESALRAGAGKAPVAELGLALGLDDLAVYVADSEFLAGRNVADRDSSVRVVGDAVVEALGCQICVSVEHEGKLTLGGSRG